MISLLLILLFLAGGYVFVTVLRSDGKVPTVFGFSFLKISTGSMEPTLETDSIIVVKSEDPDKIKTGDIICFYSRDPSIFGLPNTHRVSALTEEDGRRVFVTKGDANDLADNSPVYDEDIVGVYTATLASSAKAASVVESKYFFFFALLIPLCLIVFLEARNVSKAVKDKNGPAKRDGADEQKDDERSPDGKKED